VAAEASTDQIKAMSSTDRQRLMKVAWLDLHRELMAILYHEDPNAIGSKVGSPLDEYDGEAVDLIASLRAADGDVDRVVYSAFPTAEPSLLERVRRAWQRYEANASIK
jgi:hypothetical protein